MSWFNFSVFKWSEVLNNKLGRYLLQRYLGQFLDSQIRMEQLHFSIYEGLGVITDITLNCESLNEICDSQGWDIEVTGGHIDMIKATVPWNAPMTVDSFVEFHNLDLSLRPLSRHKDNASMLESMWSSLSSSFQLAQECLEKEIDVFPAGTQTNNVEGIERFAQMIDNVLSRVTAKLVNTTIRLEYLIPDTDRGIAIIIKINSLEYKNEAGADPVDNRNATDQPFTISSYSTYHLIVEGVSFYTEEFRISNEKKMTETFSSMSTVEDQFQSTMSVLPEPAADTHGESDEDTQSDEMGHLERSTPILFGQLTGTQDIRIKMKQAEQIHGPKVQLEMTLGSFNIFLSPRQIHMISLFYDIFIENISDSSLAPSARKSNLVNEVELKSQLNKRLGTMGSGLGLNEGWSTDPSVDTVQHQYLNVIGNQHTQMPYSGGLSDSVFSSNSSMTSSMSSSVSQSTQNTNRGRKRGTIDADPNADISHLNIRIACVAIMVLHEDILVESSPLLYECPIKEQSVDRLIVMANEFFSYADGLGIGLSGNDIENANKILDKSCKSNHLRLLLAPIIIEGEEQRNASGNLLRLSASIAHADFKEVLDTISVPLLEFSKSNISNDLPDRPDITMGVKQITQIVQRSRSTNMRHLVPPKTEITFTLAPCLTEIDISISDRLIALFSASPFYGDTNAHIPPNDVPNIDIKIDSECIDVKLRFPIADLRPRHDPNRIRWWERNVRNDYLLLQLCNTKIGYGLPSSINITSSDVNIYYCDCDSSDRIELAKAISSDKTPTKFALPKVDSPRIQIDFPRTARVDDYSSNYAKARTAAPGFKSSSPSQQNFSPFSSKRILRESDTPHSKVNTSDSDSDSENTLLPGDKVEMQQFCNDATNSSKIQIRISLPIVSLQLKSKHLYEVIYNRINSDLLLWEGVAPTSDGPIYQHKPDPDVLNVGMLDSIYSPYEMAKSGINYDSNSESEVESSDHTFQSIYDDKESFKQETSVASDQQSDISLQLNIGQGMLTMYSPVRDSQNRVIPGQLGEFVIRLNSVMLFSVNGYKGDENLGYMCIEASAAELFHFGLIPVPCPDPPLRLIGCVLPSHMQSTFYPSPKNISLSEKTVASNRDMLSIAMEIQKCRPRKIKKIKVAAGIQHATLRYNPALSEHTWLTQLIDMFDVTDCAVEGYIPLDVITEMHLHLWDCVIDYRPSFYPFRSIMTLGTFMISSNLSTASSGCTLRFVAEECTLSLAPQILAKDKKKAHDSKITVIPSRELVCVLEVGLFEVSLRLNEVATEAFPKFDLRSTVNGVHMRTCSDSADALFQLISYLASDGDLARPDEFSETAMPSAEGQAQLLPVTSNQQNAVTESQQKRVNTLMEEAMKDNLATNRPTLTELSSFDDDVEVFCFPDEASYKVKFNKAIPSMAQLRSKSLCEPNTSLEEFFDKEPSPHAPQEDSVSTNTEMEDVLNFESAAMSDAPIRRESTETLPQVATELGSIVTQSHSKTVITRKVSSDTDDEFCIIGDEERPKWEFENVRTMDDPIRIVDNHFSVPIGRADLLKAPCDFPMAVIRYTLCEVTLTWHLYGGHDFIVAKATSDTQESDYTPSSKSPAPRFPMSNTYRMGVSYSKGSSSVIFGASGKRRQSWKESGGVNRKFDILMEIQVSKMRFSHETYPTHTKQASRQVLLIKEIEIRDKLAVSQIKKFLYLPKDELKKGTQHMVVIKALHLRPDPLLTAQECSLRISLLPVRVNIDQDSLLFLVEFFNNIGSTAASANVQNRRTSTASTHQWPVMIVDAPEATQELQARKLITENLMLLMEEEDTVSSSNVDISSNPDANLPIYFRNIIFSPEVLITLDYQGKRVQMSHGPLTGLIMGLGQLQCSQIRLRRIHHRHGILGVDRLFNFLLQEWLNDIKHNQLSSVLRGVGPMYSIVQLIQGIIDLFWLPIEQYKKDGRIVRGLQLGAQSFTARTALAALEITTRFIHLLQITAETAYDIVAPGPSVRHLRGNRKGKRKRMHPPQDIREGVTNALMIVREGVGDTAQTICEMTALEHDQKGYTGAVGAVIRQIPPTVVKPIVLATQATSNVLGGVRNQLVPDARREAKEKWKDEDD